MINKRKILALIILLAGVIISVSVVSSGDDGGKITTAISEALESNPALDFENSDKENSKLKIPGGSDGNSGGEDVNMTDSLAEAYSEILFQKISGGIFPSEDDAVEELLKKNYLQSLTYKTFDEKDIKVSLNNSGANQIAYVEEVDRALWNNFGEIKNENTSTAINKFFENDDPSVLKKLIEVTPGYLDDLLQAEVPSTWKDFHLEMLNVWQKKLTVYEAIYDYESDPSKASLAVQDLPEIVRKSKDLQLIMVERYEELTNG